MLRKTLIALAATAALGIGAGTADARGGGAYSGGSGAHSSGSGMHSSGSGMHSSGSGMHYSGVRGVSTPGHVTTMGPRGGTWRGANWNGGQWGHHHHRHGRFFGAGFYGYGYGYGYDSCWRLAQTYYGWQRVWVCGDYPYWGY
jgi:hypothetical protein